MKRTPELLPATTSILHQLGENVRLARLRRRLSAEQVAQRANISRSTLWMIEKGSPAVAMGAYMQALFVLGLEKDILRVASDDVMGEKLQSLGTPVRKRAPKKQNRE